MQILSIKRIFYFLLLVFCIFVMLHWITVVLVFISTLIFNCSVPTFFQFTLGAISINSFVKQLDINDMRNNLLRWIRVIMEMCSKSYLLVFCKNEIIIMP